MTWGEAQIEQYRQAYPLGSMARLALELMLNIAARRHDAHLIGRQHMSFDADQQFWKLTWRPRKTSEATGKVLTVRILPELQSALGCDAAHRRADPFILNEHGRPFKSAHAFGSRFCRLVRGGWVEATCFATMARPATIAAAGCARQPACKSRETDVAGPEIMHVSGHATLGHVKVYLDAVDQSGWPKRRWPIAQPDQNEHTSDNNVSVAVTIMSKTKENGDEMRVGPTRAGSTPS